MAIGYLLGKRQHALNRLLQKIWTKMAIRLILSKTLTNVEFVEGNENIRFYYTMFL